jgi:hypothetical protein
MKQNERIAAWVGTLIPEKFMHVLEQTEQSNMRLELEDIQGINNIRARRHTWDQ